MKSLECGLHVAATFCDLSKAFDCVNHGILLYKLQRYGIRGISLRLVKNYLMDRKQCVYYNNDFSSIKNLNIGVGQGTVIGPLLFLLFINDLPNVVNAATIMYADDTTFINNGVDQCNIAEAKSLTMTEASQWFVHNKLKLNEDKTKHVVFSLNRLLHKDNMYQLNNVKFLGFELDSQLNWKNHIKYVAKKINSYNFMLCKVKRYVSINSAKLVYFSYIQSAMLYGIILWGRSTDWMRIFKCQKTSIRILSGVARGTS